ncbi:aldose 1-epimerase family protein [Sediminibacterium sp.]|uniref:aldose 1-epimerase family protein n=1 Tax=Sediminibacterium sp. TaxID=1917865 RepID=UPI002727E7DD|nr:aldose 1-epimerase family protein [Sediminibacterium sp.]MDO9000530.1 aldose 1-epimerase family protein [Bacteroidota bacterium]MDP3146902.1 aldose 1-epimerase family protein [Bacteroidota bacterium]MDP3567559.1 aldose 1-epimerase family protein [Sediminibacterium sp.]
MQSQIRSNKLRVSINSFGAEVCSVKNKNGDEFMWQANKKIWGRHSPVLFPIVGKLKENYFIYNEKTYELPQHGFARDIDFEVIESSSESCIFQLKNSKDTYERYPFSFVLQISYLLIENKLTTSYKVINQSDAPMFFSLGAHPAFNCPLQSDEKFEDYYLEFEKNKYSRTLLNNGLRSTIKEELKLKDNKLFLKKELFENDALVFEENQINRVSLCSIKSKHKITLECDGWPYFGIWSKKDCEQFVCLEPWHGITDSEFSNKNLSEKEGIIKLAANTEFSCNYSLVFN